MTRNAETPRAESGASREIRAVGAEPIVPHTTDDAHEGESPQLIARPVPVSTSGRLEFAARCPHCRSWHRHIGLGEKDAPCGAHYLLEFANKGAA